jgi:hypothetical protein
MLSFVCGAFAESGFRQRLPSFNCPGDCLGRDRIDLEQIKEVLGAYAEQLA